LPLRSLLTPAVAEIKTAAVSYKDGDVELEGFVACDDVKAGLRPGVLVIHDWTGVQDYTKMRTKQLAERGYVAFADFTLAANRTQMTGWRCALNDRFHQDLLRADFHAAGLPGQCRCGYR
jgi:hypothetical protein